MLIADNGYQNLANFLVSKNKPGKIVVEIDALDALKRLALFYAVTNSQHVITLCLLKAGADKNIIDGTQKRITHYAKSYIMLKLLTGPKDKKIIAQQPRKNNQNNNEIIIEERKSDKSGKESAMIQNNSLKRKRTNNATLKDTLFHNPLSQQDKKDKKKRKLNKKQKNAQTANNFQ